ncbi:MAG: SDR family oxidoreductase [Deltaproteobacteria bacterium]|nr:SDR family oxidoreductase [Deltaproteobacteria bacterium]
MTAFFDLKGKVALTTGAAEGIGPCQALVLAEYGADTIVAGPNLEDVEKIAEQARQMGRKALACQVGVDDEKSVADMVGRTMETFSRIDILVNAFGFRIRHPAVSFPVDEWQQVMDINARGTFVCCQAVGRIMVKQGSGKIINHSSVRGAYGLPSGYAAYCASKGAIDTLTKTLACEWAKDNVQVNAIAPTFVEIGDNRSKEDPAFVKMVTARIPMDRWATLDEIAGPTLFLASAASDFVTGQILYVDGGVTTW